MKSNLTYRLVSGVTLIALACAAGRMLANRSALGGGAQSPTAAVARPNSELNHLLTARYESAARLLEMEEKRLQGGATTLARVCEAARRVKDSTLELPVSLEQRLVALTNYLTITRRLEQGLERSVENGAAPLADRESARYLRLDAEIALLRAKQ